MTSLDDQGNDAAAVDQGPPAAVTGELETLLAFLGYLRGGVIKEGRRPHTGPARPRHCPVGNEPAMADRTPHRGGNGLGALRLRGSTRTRTRRSNDSRCAHPRLPEDCGDHRRCGTGREHRGRCRSAPIRFSRTVDLAMDAHPPVGRDCAAHRPCRHHPRVDRRIDWPLISSLIEASVTLNGSSMSRESGDQRAPFRLGR